MKRAPDGFHEVYGAADSAGLTPEEVAEERRARKVDVNGLKWKRGPRKPKPVANPFDEILKSLGLWDRVKAACSELGVAPMELAQDCKTKRLVTARRKVYQMLRDIGWSNCDTARLFDKDPSTILSALK